MDSSPPPLLVDCDWLKGNLHMDTVRVVDCTFRPGPPTSEPVYKEDYKKEHIPGAVHCDLNMATRMDGGRRFAPLPPAQFQQYIQSLSINNNQHIILYDRGPNGGMMFSALIWWLLKMYGHDRVSLLNGGLQAWRNSNGPVTDQLPETTAKGNWTAAEQIPEIIITFEELTRKDGHGQDMIDRAEHMNLLDARNCEQFNGDVDCGLNKTVVKGSHVPGFLNVPVSQMIAADGRFKSPNEIMQTLTSNGFSAARRPIVTSCMGGVQASLLAFAIALVDRQLPVRVYNGSLKEMEVRAPERISGGK